MYLFNSQLEAGNPPARKAILVLGMHRSGTSALTRIIHLLGADEPSTLVTARYDNPKGFWESVPLVTLNDAFLAACDSRWDDWRSLNTRRVKDVWDTAFADRALDCLRKEYGESGWFAIKDPRICRFVALWLKVLAVSNIEPLAVIPIRNPLEVAASLRSRDGFSTSQSLMIWLRHVLDAERGSRGVRRSFLRYEDLLSSWSEQVNRVATDLGIAWPIAPRDAAAEVAQFLTKDLHRHRLDIESLQASADVATWVRRTYAAVADRLEGGAEETMRRTLDEVREEFDDACWMLTGAFDVERQRDNQRFEAIDTASKQLNAEHLELEARHITLESRHIELQNRYIELNARHIELETRHLELNTRHLELEANHAELQSRFESLTRQVFDLDARFRLTLRSRLFTWMRQVWTNRRNHRLLANSELFDGDWYLEQNPDVRDAGSDPIKHYLRFGAAEGRDPSTAFSTNAYRLQHPELVDSNQNPLVHYLKAQSESIRQHSKAA